jgi:hypothetical protein
MRGRMDVELNRGNIPGTGPERGRNDSRNNGPGKRRGASSPRRGGAPPALSSEESAPFTSQALGRHSTEGQEEER